MICGRYSRSKRAEMRNVKNRGRQQLCLFSIASRQAPRPTQPPIDWVQGFFPRGQSGAGVMLTTHRYLAPRMRMSGTIPLFPLRAYIRVAKFSQKSRNHFKILGAKSKFHTKDSQY
jgi:hypothetical protein